MKKIILLIVIAMLFTTDGFGQDCRKYFGKGYCVDYIKQRVGRKQSGNAGTWRGNINNIKEIRPGDVAIFTSPGVGHVAVVERVIYERNTDKPYQIEISEMNWGRASANAEEKGCSVTQMFNQVGRRTIRVTAVSSFWRP